MVSDQPALEHRLAAAGPRLRAALIANLGRQLGDDAYAEAMFWAWSHPDEMAGVTAVVPYLFRVGKSRIPRRRRTRPLSPEPDVTIPEIEPRLLEVLASLSPRQRTAVVLVVAWGWSHREVAELLGISKASVQRHADRGLARLRTELGVDTP